MVTWRIKLGKRKTGGSIHKNAKKQKFQCGMEFVETKVGSRRAKSVRRLGGLKTTALLGAEKANVLDLKTGKSKPAKITLVSQNEANPHYTRRNIITKGAVIKTELGPAKVTNRPSREGVVNAVLIESK